LMPRGGGMPRVAQARQRRLQRAAEVYLAQPLLRLAPGGVLVQLVALLPRHAGAGPAEAENTRQLAHDLRRWLLVGEDDRRLLAGLAARPDRDPRLPP